MSFAYLCDGCGLIYPSRSSPLTGTESIVKRLKQHATASGQQDPRESSEKQDIAGPSKLGNTVPNRTVDAERHGCVHATALYRKGHMLSARRLVQVLSSHGVRETKQR